MHSWWYLCDLELQESKQETSYRPGKSKGAGSLTLATRPHFKPWIHDSPGEPAPEMSKTYSHLLSPH